MSPESRLYAAIARRSFSEHACFLCGGLIDGAEITSEHVIPRWAQRRFNLWDQKLALLNTTTIPYRNLTIPCCRDCNTLRLQPMEDEVHNAIEKGYTGVANLEHHKLFIWLGKIFYGLLYKEFSLPVDRRNPLAGAIVGSDLLESFELHHYLLQSVRVPMTFDGNHPASILVLPVLAAREPRLSWDFIDNFQTMYIACRVGEVGIIAFLQDGGAHQETLFRDLQELSAHPLHPLQFRELIAASIYSASIFDRRPKYAIVGEAPTCIVQLPLQGLSTKPIFREWNQRDYAAILEKISPVRPRHPFFEPPDKVASWIFGPNGTRRKLSFEDEPWPHETPA